VSDPEKPKTDEPAALVKENAGLALAFVRNDRLSPMGARVRFRKKDQVILLTVAAETEKIGKIMSENGWRLAREIGKEEFSTSQCRIESF
jgi:hypothetical protein